MTYITGQQVVDTIIRVCEDNPTKTNPMGFDEDGLSTCLYDDGHGAHCIAGQVLYQLTGVEIGRDVFMPVESAINNNEQLADRFDTWSINLLTQAQRLADNVCDDEDGYDMRPRPREWGDVLNHLRASKTV